MGEISRVYIQCAHDNDAFADCTVINYGDFFRLLGHSQMDFVASDAKKLAYSILDALPDPDREEVRATECSGDAIVDEIRSMLLERSKMGQAKYGTTLMRNDLGFLDWMRHAIEESLDRVLYMARAVKDLESSYDDGR